VKHKLLPATPKADGREGPETAAMCVTGARLCRTGVVAVLVRPCPVNSAGGA